MATNIHTVERPARVVHLSGDFPDPIEAQKTRAIESFLVLTADRFDHQVISMNRQLHDWPRFVADVARNPFRPQLRIRTHEFSSGTSLIYAAPPRGLYHAAMLRRLGDWLAGQLAARPPDLLVGHKLTIEGIVVATAARLLGVPYAILLQGKTDARVLSARPDLRQEFASVYHGAAAVLALTPWIASRAETRLGRRERPCYLVPAPTELDSTLKPQFHGTGLLSVFHLKNWKNKNLRGLLAAHRMMGNDGLSVPLSVIGGGTLEDWNRCHSLARGNRLVHFTGDVGRQEMARHLNRATALVLPSFSESFGLVFVEALFAGLPIVYPKGQALTGYLDSAPFAIPVNPGNPREIAAAMRHVVQNEAALKAALADWQSTAAAARFSRASIRDQFTMALNAAMKRDHGAAENGARAT